jgi:GNAT superfamily N-acetyltransferase
VDRLTAYRRPALLTEAHVVHGFDCGKAELNSFLVERAAFNHAEGYSRTYVISDAHDHVAGYYSICSSMIGRENAPRQIGGHGAPGAIPVLLLARLAVDRAAQGRGIGGLLLRHAFETAVLSAERVGRRAILVHAIDDDAERFYVNYGFRRASGVERTLLRSLKDIASSLAAVKLEK